MRDGKRVPIDVRLAVEGVVRHNVRVHPGDIIVVPPALDGRIVVLGHVNKPGTVSWRRGLRLTEVLADCGGMTKSADSEDIRVLRGGYAHPKLYVANAKDVLAGVRPDVVLAQGDVIYVTEHWFASMGDVLEKIVPAAATVGLILLAH
jgi:polysaccharide biosynthesis/export protein